MVMKLSDWLTLSGRSVRGFAKEIGVSNENTVYRYINGSRVPRAKIMKKISEVSAGAVTPNDFVTASEPVVAQGAAA